MKKLTKVLGTELKVINIGLQSFADDLESQGVKVTRVDWKPPAGGDKKMMELLEKLGS